MYLEQYVLASAGRRSTTTIQRSALAGQRTGFLCHSHHNRTLALGLQQRLKEDGLNLYVGWQDSSMPSEPDQETASRIKTMVRSSDIFLFLATEHSMSSRWCLWEIGFGDGTKQNSQIIVVPTRDSSGHYHGNEHLKLYRRLETSSASGPIYWYPTGGYSAGGPVRTL